MGATKPSIVNIVLTDADTEYKHKLPEGCKRFQLQMRDATDFRMAFLDDVVARPNPGYFTVKSGTVFKSEGLFIEEDIWLYFACASSGKIVEIVQWV